MKRLKNNKKYMIIKNKYKDYYIINKTEKKLLLDDNNGNYLIVQPRGKQKITEEVFQYV